MFIGPKQIKSNTPDTNGIVRVEYEDGTEETLSQKMYDAVVSEATCDLTTLREKRIRPVVAEILSIMRDWGIKISELQYFSAVLTESLRTNENEAVKLLWQEYIPTLTNIDDIDLVAIDRVLREKSTKSIPSPYKNEPNA